jgi:carbohydrate diacid regulator
MENELKHIIKSIVEKTGIEFAVRAIGKDDNVKFSSSRIIVNSDANKTYFRFSFRGGEYVAAITGTDKTTANYAYLISSLIENSAGADLALGLNDYLKKIVVGECSKLQVEKFHVKFNVPDIPCYSLVIEAPAGTESDVINVLESYSANTLDTSVVADDSKLVFVKFVDMPSDIEYQSPSEFAEYLCQSVFEEIGAGIKIGVGTVVRHLTDLHTSYQQALSALKMSEVFNSKGSVHSYKEYVLIKMLEEIPRGKLKEYLDILSGEDSDAVFDDEDMLNTAEEFLENSLNVSETSRNLFMHRNTLIYRLDKIEKSTGLNIKNFSDAVTFRLITILHKIIG